ncbi:hypothetical protein ES703_113816 [subsurface metagenome]
MRDILIPFRIEDLLLKPEMAGRITLSDDMQQTLASLVGYDGVARRLLRSSRSGILYTASPRIHKIVHVARPSDPYVWTGSDIKTTEIMVMGHPSNTGLIWVKNDEAIVAADGWPLGSKEVLNLTLDNLINLNIFFATAGDVAIVAYTR